MAPHFAGGQLHGVHDGDPRAMLQVLPDAHAVLGSLLAGRVDGDAEGDARGGEGDEKFRAEGVAKVQRDAQLHRELHDVFKQCGGDLTDILELLGGDVDGGVVHGPPSDPVLAERHAQDREKHFQFVHDENPKAV